MRFAAKKKAEPEPVRLEIKTGDPVMMDESATITWPDKDQDTGEA